MAFKFKIHIAIPVFTGTIFCMMACTPKNGNEVAGNGDPIQYTVAPAPEWTAIFKRSSGWFGGDGIFAIPFSGNDAATPDDSILFLFSDTMVGEIKEGALQPGYEMVNNSVMILKGNQPSKQDAHFLVNHKNGKSAAVFVPNTPRAVQGDYYWLGDGFVNHATDTSLYIFAHRIHNTDDGSAFPFREVGDALLIIPYKSNFPFEQHRQLGLPFSSFTNDSLSVSLGSAVFVNTAAAGSMDADGFVYIYGVRGKTKELIASRVKAESIENFSAWEFWDGSKWGSEIGKSAAIADSVSNELSVTAIGKNRYALIYQYGGIYPVICMQIGSTPVGPFGPRQKIWDTSGDVTAEHQFAYNAKAHPAISKPGELLVSYNVNSFEFFEDIKIHPNLYRPRFVKITFQK